MWFIYLFVISIICIKNIESIICCNGQNTQCKGLSKDITKCLDTGCHWNCLFTTTKETQLKSPPPKVITKLPKKQTFDDTKNVNEWINLQKKYIKTPQDEFKEIVGLIEIDVANNKVKELEYNKDLIQYIKHFELKGQSTKGQRPGKKSVHTNTLNKGTVTSTGIIGGETTPKRGVRVQRRRLQYKNVNAKDYSQAPYNSIVQISFGKYFKWMDYNNKERDEAGMEIVNKYMVATGQKIPDRIPNIPQNEQHIKQYVKVLTGWVGSMLLKDKEISDAMSMFSDEGFDNWIRRKFAGGSFVQSNGVGAVVKRTHTAVVVLTVAHNLVQITGKGPNDYILADNVAIRIIPDPRNSKHDIVYENTLSSVFLAKYKGQIWDQMISIYRNYDFALAVFQVPQEFQNRIPPPLHIDYVQHNAPQQNIQQKGKLIGDSDVMSLFDNFDFHSAVNKPEMVLKMPTYDFRIDDRNNRIMREFIEPWTIESESVWARENHWQHKAVAHQQAYKQGMSGSPLLENHNRIVGVFTAISGQVYATRFDPGKAAVMQTAIARGITRNQALEDFVIWFRWNSLQKMQPLTQHTQLHKAQLALSNYISAKQEHDNLVSNAEDKYYNLLADYEYDVAVEEAREKKASILIQNEKNKLLTAAHNIKKIKKYH